MFESWSHYSERRRTSLLCWFVITSITISLITSSGSHLARAESDSTPTAETTIEDVPTTETEIDSTAEADSEPVPESDPSLDTTDEQESDPSEDVPTEPEPEVQATEEVPVDEPTSDDAVTTPDESDDSSSDGEPTADPSATEVETETVAESALEDSEESDPTPADDSPEPTPTPEPVGTLSYTPADQLQCKPANNVVEPVTSGGFVDFTCDYQVALVGEHLDSSEISLLWSITASISTGWSVQFLDPEALKVPDPVWSEEQAERGVFKFSSTLRDVPASLDDTRSIRFGLRLHRAQCETALPRITLNADVHPEIPDTSTTINPPATTTLPFDLTPDLAPIPEPSLSFSGSLDFGTIPVDAYGVQQAPEPQTLTVTVSGLDQACGDWKLVLKAKNLDDNDGASINASSLSIVSIDGTSGSDGGCPLNDGCLIAQVTAGPDAPPETSYSLGVSLVLPDQLYATTFNSTLTATLKEDT